MTMSHLSIVIIEDEISHFSLMKRTILKAFSSIEIHHFEDASSCLERLDEISPDIIVSDYLMPGMNGIEFLEALNQSGKDFPVIIITGQGAENIAVRAMKLGAWDYLVKSSDFFTLLPSVIEKVLREKKNKDLLREAEEALRLERERFFSTLERIPAFVYLHAPDYSIRYCNKTFRDLFGDPQGKLCYEIIKGRDKPCEPCVTNEVFMTKKNRKWEWRRENGEVYILYDNYLTDVDGSPLVLKMGVDITEQKKAEEHIQSLTHELIRAQERERTAIALELHDTILQDLVALKLKCDIFFANQAEISSKVRQWTKEHSGTLQRTITSLRDLACDLYPSGLRQWGLVKTLNQYCQDFSKKSGLDIIFSCNGMDGLMLDSETETTLYRLVQEGLNNIRKHADASKVFISLLAASPQIVLTIEDNGKGFNVDKRLEVSALEKRMGLRSMNERICLLGGEMRIESHPGQGTKILLQIPFS